MKKIGLVLLIFLFSVSLISCIQNGLVFPDDNQDKYKVYITSSRDNENNITLEVSSQYTVEEITIAYWKVSDPETEDYHINPNDSRITISGNKGTLKFQGPPEKIIYRIYVNKHFILQEEV